ncbi:MAG: AAA family ATPase [Thermodesulfobacteriota bacterium]
MNYLKTLGLDREPFSNTPDPEFFFPSRQHYGCLQKLEVLVRLRRGLGVVIGDVGSGKTTICRQMIRRLARDETLECHLILDPGFESASEFLSKVAEMFTGKKPDPGARDWEVKESIKNFLFQRGVEEGRSVILIIDEGQKIPDYGLEILREFLNYETNEYKLLQIIIFAQKEFERIVKRQANFADRISLYHTLRPLDFRDTRAMIQYRLDQASGTPDPPDLFTLPGLWAIYQASGGYPRKIVNLCHLCTLAVIIGERSRVDWFLARSRARTTAARAPVRWPRTVATGLVAAALAAGLIGFGPLALSAWKKDEAPPPEPRAAVARPGPPPLVARLADDLPPALPAPAVAVEPPEPVPSAVEPDQAPAALEPAVSLGPDLAAGETEPVAIPAPAAQPPQLLGRVVVEKGETLSTLMRQVYGHYRSGLMGVVRKANPHIADLSKLQPGDEINFPALPVSWEDQEDRRWGVELAGYPTLSEALPALKAYPGRRRQTRIIPSWTQREGLVFRLVLAETFPDQTAAGTEAEKVRELTGREVKVTFLPVEGTVYYSDLWSR